MLGDFLIPLADNIPFFSHVHHTFTRIDYFLLDNRLLPNLVDCKYEAIVLADHAPVCLKIHFDSFIKSHIP